MSDVTGPISSLPGSLQPDDMMCDNHPDRPAIHRVQGETDSFGCELNDLCEECYAQQYVESSAPQEAFPCDYCKTKSTDLRAIRDPDVRCADCAGFDLEWMRKCEKHGLQYCCGCSCPECAEDSWDDDYDSGEDTDVEDRA